MTYLFFGTLILAGACDITSGTSSNSIGMEFVLVKAGSFEMGMEEDPKEAEKVFAHRVREFGNELPRHPVRFERDIRFGRHEVTVGQFARFIDATDYKTIAEKEGTGEGLEMKDGRVVGANAQDVTLYSPFIDDARFNWRNTGMPQNDRHPVVNVAPQDAEAFCRWLSTMEKATYRLPTEAEWEYACRAGTTTRYSSGDDPLEVTKVGNIADQSGAKMFPHWSKHIASSDDGFAFTAPVGSFAANAWGIHDMHGNVWEWCQDTAFRKYPKSDEETVDPLYKAEDPFRIVRGGCWTKWTTHCRSAKRYRNPDTKASLNVGFRVVCE